MKRILTLALLAAVGCSSTEPAPAPEPGTGAAVDTKEVQLQELRRKIAARRYDLAQADADLAAIARDREQLSSQPASNEKTERMASLGKAEEDAKLKKQSAESEIATYESQYRELSGQAKPKSAEEALDQVFASEAQKEKEAEEAKRIAAERALSEEKRRIAEAERAKMAEEIAKSKEKLGSGGPGSEGDSIFEERWADVILKVRVELEKYRKD